MPVALKTSNLTKRYGDSTVLDGVSLEVQAGEIHALLGANGAGKSTLVKIASGLISRSSGDIEVDGASVKCTSKADAEAVGVQIVQQELNLLPTLNVAENLYLSRLPHRCGVVSTSLLHQNARRALDRLGLTDVATDTMVGALGIGYQQLIEIASALDRQCKILILDEPTAALSGSETERLFEQLKLLREKGVAIVYISHRMDEILRIADRVTILRDGQLIATQPAHNMTVEAMVALMSGEDRATQHVFTSHATTQLGLDVDNYCDEHRVRSVSFKAFRGERVGIAGLVGAGRTELLRLIFGSDRATSGTVAFEKDGNRQRFTHPSQAVQAGMAMVTEDRKLNGSLLSQSIRVNTTLNSVWDKFSRLSVIQRQKEQIVTREYVDRLETKYNHIEQAISELSGGNQQKVIIAKWLVRDAKVFFFDEPTRGIDVAARNKIYGLFELLARELKTLVIVSSDLEELMQNCDRILVMSAGRITAEFRRGEWSVEKINEAAFAGHRSQSSEFELANLIHPL